MGENGEEESQQDVSLFARESTILFLLSHSDHGVTSNNINKNHVIQSPLDSRTLECWIDGTVPSSTSGLLYSGSSSVIERSPRLWF